MASQVADQPAESIPPPEPEKKGPPPEPAKDVRRRTWIVLSFWLIVLCLGLPIWYQTTTIYRADLPIDRMLEWADGKACRPVFPLQITVEAPTLQESEAQNLVRLTQHALDDLNDFAGHHLRLRLADPSASDKLDNALTIRLKAGDGTSTSASASLHNTEPVLDITYPTNAVPSGNSASSPLATYIARELRETFAEEQAIISYLLSKSSMSGDSRPRSLTPELAESISKRTTRSLRYAPTYHLSFSLFTDGALPSTWDFNAAVEAYVQPMLDVLRPIHDFTIDSQIQLYATPGVSREVLQKEDLASFINAAEWPLSPSIGGAPTVNFVLYVGNQTIATGATEDKETSQSWLIPQWGTVFLLSLPSNTAHVSKESLREPMLTFDNHLLSLLGTPHTGSLPLRLSTLSRIRSADLLLRASSSLGSLARLSLNLPSISIPRSVASSVTASLAHLELACSNLGNPQGLKYARVAEEEADRAFFEKSMVGQLYFPDEHKIAVYLPLLGPVGVPLVMGLLNEVKKWRQRRKEAAKAAKEKKGQ